MANITLNNEKNGIEVTFESKPAQATIDQLKQNGFRWSPKKKLWYAKQTTARMEFTATLGEVPAVAPAPAYSINMEGVGSKKYFGAGAELAKTIREELKARGVKGCTVRVNHYDSITVTVKATAEDMASIEEAMLRHTYANFTHEIDCFGGYGVYDGSKWIYSADFERMTDEEREGAYYRYVDYSIKHFNEFSYYHHDHNRNQWELTEAFYNKCYCILQIANQWNYDNSDSMTDYFDRGYYLTIAIKKPEDFEPRATMTDAERVAYKEEQERKEREEAEALKALQEEQERARIEHEQHEKWVKESEELIYNDVHIEDLEEAIYMSNLTGAHGKECCYEELMQDLDTTRSHEALITRIVSFTSQEAFVRFNKLYLNSFDFIAGTGGTATEDIRFNDMEEYNKLTAAQRDTIKWYMKDCVLIRLNGIDKLVIDAEGASYARYVYIVTEDTKTGASAPVIETMRKESEQKPAFYFPAPVEEQINNIKIGDEITIYKCDGWILNDIYGGKGLVLNTHAGTWAQYEGVYIDLLDGKKSYSVFIRNNHPCLIYKGIKGRLPKHVTEERISENMVALFNYDLLFPNVYNYYKEQGEEPIIDTWQR